MIALIYNLICRNPSVKFSDVYPREDDDDKTWRGDDSWRVNAGKLNSCYENFNWILLMSGFFCTTFDHSVSSIIFSDQNIYSEPPGNQDSQNPLDDDIGITNPRNEKALEKMGELHSVTYSGSKRIL